MDAKINANILSEKGFFFEKAALLALSSEIAYARKNREDWKERFKELGFTDFEFLEKKEVDFQSYFAFNNDCLVMTNRGSKSNEGWDNKENKDWYYNFQCKLVDTQYGKIHEGFYTIVKGNKDIEVEKNKEKVDGVYDDIIRIIDSIQGQRKRKFLGTGHSQGAGTNAVLNHIMKLEKYKNQFDEMIVYGLSRWCDGTTGDLFWSRAKGSYWWVRNNNDIITRIPTRTFFGYKHTKGYVYITSLGAIKTNTIFIQDLFDGLFGRLIDIADLDLDCIDDHYPEHYVNHFMKASGVDYNLKKFDS